jgi:type II secretory pathway pseudopilin PulG
LFKSKNVLKICAQNNKGLTILEVLVAAGLVAIISLGVATIFENVAIERKKAVLLDTLRELKNRIEADGIRDQSAWLNTINDSIRNPSLTCVSNTTTCTVQDPATGSPTKIILKSSGGSVLFDMLDWAGTGTNGFTETGAYCTTFSSTADGGNDACPISYRLVHVMFCPGLAATCINPTIKITARLIFNPGPKGMLNRFRGLIAVGNLSNVGTTGADATADDGKYDVGITRTTAELNRFFKIAMTVNGGAAGCATGGAGTCNVGVMSQHPRGWTLSQENDPYDLVNYADGVNLLTFKQTGFYGCTIAVTAFATQGFTAGLYNSSLGTMIAQASTVAGFWSQSTAVIETKFNVTSTTQSYRIYQMCDALPGGTPNANNCTLGMNSTAYSSPGTQVVTMSCYRFDRNF